MEECRLSMRGRRLIGRVGTGGIMGGLGCRRGEERRGADGECAKEKGRGKRGVFWSVLFSLVPNPNPNEREKKKSFS